MNPPGRDSSSLPQGEAMVITSQNHPTLPILGSQTLGLGALQAAFLLIHFFIFPLMKELLGFKRSIKEKHKAFHWCLLPMGQDQTVPGSPLLHRYKQINHPIWSLKPPQCANKQNPRENKNFPYDV